MNKKAELSQQEIVKGASFLIVAALMIFFFVIPSCSDEPEKSEEKKLHTKVEACLQSRSFVEKMLKSPGSAEFGYCADDHVTQIDDTTFTVINYVDSQNSFGALIRNYYKCKITFSGKMAYCDGLHFEEHGK
jgi:hypothetical protein